MKKRTTSRARTGGSRPRSTKPSADRDGASSAAQTTTANEPSHVVGVGGSAGSLEPLERFFAAVPRDTTMSFVVVTHRDPRSKEMMPDILSRFTQLPVREATHGAVVERGVICIVPSDKHFAIQNGRIDLVDRPSDSRARAPIDFLFGTIAAAHGERSVGVVLSGMGTDGTVGLAAIKARHGSTLVQDPASCTYDAMPRSAIVAGVADFVGTPESLVETLETIVANAATTGVAGRDAATTGVAGRDAAAASPNGALDAVLAAVRTRTGHDFSQYKKNTLLRRIDRRSQHLRVPDLSRYLAYVARHPEEIDRLVGDLLIGVTRFFRDPEVFSALKQRIALLLEANAPERPLRVWVAGCATGEEAYSLAIAIRECWEQRHGTEPLHLQIYATDLDGAAIRHARQGVYAKGLTADVSPERLARFFVADGARYRVTKTIRDTVVFATQNLVSDPPFTKLDILSCRNVLIYLEPELQRRLLPIFLYALKPRGLLVLGASEGVNGFEDGFRPVVGERKIFERKTSAPTPDGAVELRPAGVARPGPQREKPPVAAQHGTVARRTLPEVVQRLVVEHIAPTVIVVDRNGELLHASRPTGRYFQPPAGKASTNVFAMAREGLALPLRTALRRASARGTKVKQRGVRVRTNGHDTLVDLSVVPLREGDVAGGALIAFDETPKVLAPRSGKKAASKSKAGDRAALVRLRETKAQLDALMTEMRRSEETIKAANEELQITNEELQSTNEELQSTNEELTTSKEEMQSMNEELLTLNAELQKTNEQLATTNDDMRNLLNSSQIPTLFLDNELRLKRFTAEATRIAHLISSDVGRPITDLAWSLRYTTLARDVKRVLDTLVSMETEVVAEDGATYTMRVHPYRTMDDVIDGVVITFMDISSQKREAAAMVLEERKRLLARTVGRWPGVAWVEDVRTRRPLIVSAASEKILGYPRKALEHAKGAFWEKLRGSKDRELRLPRAGGKVVTYRETTVVLARDEAGEAELVLHFLRQRSRTTEGTS
jgi:two-component system, chemotaxis family, CheB/CheR fusion protein